MLVYFGGLVLVDFGMLVLEMDYSGVRYYILGMGRMKSVQQS